MYNHNKAQQSKNRVHISWDILYIQYNKKDTYHTLNSPKSTDIFASWASYEGRIVKTFGKNEQWHRPVTSNDNWSWLTHSAQFRTWHTKAKTKCPAFCRQFQMRFFALKSLYIKCCFVPQGQINNDPSLVQIMTWRRIGFSRSGISLSRPEYSGINPREVHFKFLHEAQKCVLLSKHDQNIL